MPSSGIFLRPAAVLALVLALVHAASSAAGLAGNVVCDAGQFAEMLSARDVSPEELWRLCRGRYSESICHSAGHSLLNSEHQSGSASYQQWARSACDAVEAVASQQRALLLRQSRNSPRIEDAEAKRLADIRSSATHHQLSLNVARRYRESARAAAAAGSTARGRGSTHQRFSNSVDEALQHKSIPFPHGTFNWESNTKANNSASLDKLVKDWSKARVGKVNMSSTGVVSRVNAFKNFIIKSPTPAANTLAANVTIAAAITNAVAKDNNVTGAKAALNGSQPLALQDVIDSSKGSELVKISALRTIAQPHVSSSEPVYSVTSKELEELVEEVMAAAPADVTKPHITLSKSNF